MQIVTKNHFQSLMQQVADARASADSQVRQKDEVISDLRGQLATVTIERKEMLDIILYRERQYMQPTNSVPAQNELDSWSSIMQQQIDEIQESPKE